MEILSQYSNDNLQLIQDNHSTYSISDFNVNSDIIKLSVFSDAGSFLLSADLIINTDFFIKNNQLFLKPNEYLDREGFAEGNYNLQFDFINRLPRESGQNYFYIAAFFRNNRIFCRLISSKCCMACIRRFGI